MLRHSLYILLLVLCGTLSLPGQSVVSNPEVRAKDPVISPEGNTLFYTRTDHERNKGSDNAADIWIREKDDRGQWQRALNPGSPINSFSHDRALGLTPDGQRLAVLRTGGSDHLEILEATGRNWRIINSWPLPEEVAPRYDLTFNPNSLELVYSGYGPNGSLDLMSRTALPNGKWTAPVARRELNGPDNEMNPSFAADGRTLYFRRDNDIWWRQDNAGEAPFQTIIPRRIRQFATTPAMGSSVVATSSSPGVGEVLIQTKLEIGDLPLYSAVHRGFLAYGLPEGQLTAPVEINEERSLKVRPDVLKRYAIFLRSGEKLNAEAEYTDLPPTGEPEGGLASTGITVRETSADRKILEVGIANRERELLRLEEERRIYQEFLNRSTNAVTNSSSGGPVASTRDTVPPRRTAKGTTVNSTRARYAEDLSELARMKAKFRKQQEEKLRGTNQRGAYDWSEPVNPGAPTTPNTYDRGQRPDLLTAYGNGWTIDELTPYEREQLRQDSLRMEANIQAGLFPDEAPEVYEREAWENQLSESLPQREPITAAEAARLDREYERKLAELEALKTQLRDLENRDASPSPNENYYPPREDYQRRKWTAKGSPTPTTYDRSLSNDYPATEYPRTGDVPAAPERRRYPEPAPATYGAPTTSSSPAAKAGVPAGVSFIPNTAYPNAAGYEGLDQLVSIFRSGSPRGVLEIRVHVSTELDRRVAQLLSEERATSIREYLLEEGIPDTLFRVIGYGNHLTGAGGERVELIRP